MYHSKSMYLRNAVVSVIDSHSCDRGSNPSHGNHIICYVMNNIQFISDESSAELVVCLCE